MKSIKKQADTKKKVARRPSEEKQDLNELLNRVGDKWSILLIVVLSRSPDQTARFSELLRLIGGISQRMLTTTLRSLERDGFVTREIFPVIPPRVEYSLTKLGSSLLVPMEHLVEWVLENRFTIRKARELYDRKSQKL